MISLVLLNYIQPSVATFAQQQHQVSRLASRPRPPNLAAAAVAIQQQQPQLLEQSPFESARLVPKNLSTNAERRIDDSTALTRVAANQLNFDEVQRSPTRKNSTAAPNNNKAQISSRSTRTWQAVQVQQQQNISADSMITREALDLSESQSIKQMNCALILKRTYIVKKADDSDEWGDKFVFNDVDSNVKKQQVLKSDLCIKHSDVDRAIEEAKHRVKFEKTDDLDSLELSDLSIADVAELNLAAGRILTEKFDLSHDEILNALPMIDMSSSKFYWKNLCPKHVRSMICTKSRYRTITAHCNNLKHPSWGAAKTPYSRYLPPDYADGLSAPRASRSGEPLPSARLISSKIHWDADEPSNDYSSLFASWGQLLNHDITRIAVGNGKWHSQLIVSRYPPLDAQWNHHHRLTTN